MENTQQNQQHTAIQHSAPLRLSPHFTLAEFTASGIACKHGIDNTPQPGHIENMRTLCRNVLEPLRRRFGVLRVTSGYRCPEVNALAGGAPHSQHLHGEAADIHTGGKEVSEKIYEYARKHLTYDQLLLEHAKKTGTRWLHVSYRRHGGQRMEARRKEV